ncbi:MAG: type II secretion system protein GspN [Myxococcota bacterium]
MKRRALTIARWVGYPMFYLGSLLFFLYVTFPFEPVRDRIVAEFDRAQAAKKGRRPGEQPMRLQIDGLDGHWVTGVEMTGVRLIIPPKVALPGAKKKGGLAGFGSGGASDGGDDKDTVAKPTELFIDRATARVQLWSLLTGDLRVDVEAEAFGGTVSGTVPGGGVGDVDVSFEGIQLGRIAPLADVLQGIPVFGLASGQITLEPREKKFSKADGKVAIQIDGLKLGKKTKNDEGQVEDVVSIQGMSVPSVQAGRLTIAGDVSNGLLTFTEVLGQGRDFEVVGEGKLKLSDVWNRSTLDAFLKFKFTDAYRSSSDATIALLGKPGASGRPLVEMPGSPLGRAKADEGFYRFQLKGPLGRLKPRPAGTAGGRSKRTSAKKTKGKLPRARARPAKRPSSVVDRKQNDDGDEDEQREEKEDAEEEAGASSRRRSPSALRRPSGSFAPRALASPRLRASTTRRPEAGEEEAEPQEDGDPGADPAGEEEGVVDEEPAEGPSPEEPAPDGAEPQ